MVSSSIVLALSAAVAYGAGDFFGGLATRRAAIFAVVVPVQVIGLIALVIAIPFSGGVISRDAIVMGTLAGICGAGGIAFLYHALAIGKMGVVSPVTAVLAAAVPVVAGTFHGERLGVLQMLGIAAALIAVVMISVGADEHGRYELSAAGLKEACASGLLLSAFYIFLGFAPRSGGIYPLVFSRAASAVVLAAIALAAGKAMIPPRGSRRATMACSVLDVTANGLYVAAVQTGLLSITAVVTSLYPASTVIMARLFLKERLEIWQSAGVVLALAGVALISR